MVKKSLNKISLQTSIGSYVYLFCERNNISKEYVKPVLSLFDDERELSKQDPNSAMNKYKRKLANKTA